MIFSDQQLFEMAEYLVAEGAEIVGKRSGVMVRLPGGRELKGETLRDVLTELLSEDPGAVRYPEPIDEVRALVPESGSLCITTQVWAAPWEANSGVHIWDGKRHHDGKTFRQALASLARQLPRLTPYSPNEHKILPTC